MSIAQAFSAFHDGAFQAFGVAADNAVHAGAGHGGKNHFIARVGQTDQQVLAQGALEQAVVLLQETDFLAQQLSADVTQLQAINADVAFLRAVHAAQHAQQRGFACANRADNRNAFAGFDFQSGHRNHGWILAIGELHIGQKVMAFDVGWHQGVLDAVVVRFKGVQAL